MTYLVYSKTKQYVPILIADDQLQIRMLVIDIQFNKLGRIAYNGWEESGNLFYLDKNPRIQLMVEFFTR